MGLNGKQIIAIGGAQRIRGWLRMWKRGRSLGTASSHDKGSVILRKAGPAKINSRDLTIGSWGASLALVTITETNPLGAPTNPWMIHDVTLVIAAVGGVALLLHAVLKRRLSLAALVFFASFLVSWQEFFDDWSVYLLWNPEFPRLPWGEMRFTTPYKPLFLPFSWAWFNGFAITALVSLVIWIHRRVPKISTGLLSALIVGPMFWAYDVYIEFNATVNGWWNYTQPVGPVLNSPRGPFPLVWPVGNYVAWAVVFVWLLTLRDDRGFFWHERKLGIDRQAPGALRELARLGSLGLVWNVTNLVITVIPHYIYRLGFGGPSTLMP